MFCFVFVTGFCWWE